MILAQVIDTFLHVQYMKCKCFLNWFCLFFIYSKQMLDFFLPIKSFSSFFLFLVILKRLFLAFQKIWFVSSQFWQLLYIAYLLFDIFLYLCYPFIFRRFSVVHCLSIFIIHSIFISYVIFSIFISQFPYFGFCLSLQLIAG